MNEVCAERIRNYWWKKRRGNMEHSEQNETMHKKFQIVAQELGWKYQHKYEHGGYLQSPIFRLFFRIDHQKNRYNISLTLPSEWPKRFPSDLLSYEEKFQGKEFVTDITVSAGKSPETIARDIQNRLVAGCVEIYNRGFKAKTEYDEYKAKLEAQLRALQAIVPDMGPGCHYRPESHVLDTASGRWGDHRIQCSLGTTMQLEVSSVSTELAVKILELVVNHKEGE